MPKDLVDDLATPDGFKLAKGFFGMDEGMPPKKNSRRRARNTEEEGMFAKLEKMERVERIAEDG